MQSMFLAPLRMQSHVLTTALFLSTRLAMLTLRSQARFMSAFVPKPVPKGRAGACMPFSLRS